MIFGYEYEVYLIIIGLIILSILAFIVVDYSTKRVKKFIEKSKRLSFLQKNQYEKVANFLARLGKSRNQ